MIQRSKLGLKLFSPAFSTPCLSSGPVNRSDAWHITVALPAQKGCAQTISANVLKRPNMTTNTTWQAHARYVEKWNNKIRYQSISSGSNFHRKKITPKLTFRELAPLLLALTRANPRKVSFEALLNILDTKLQSARNVYTENFNTMPISLRDQIKNKSISLHETDCTPHFVSLDDFERWTFRKKKRKKETGNGVRASARIRVRYIMPA